MKKIRESVLYFPSNDADKTRQVKAVLVQMGVRIRNLTNDLAGQQIGHLMGCEGFEARIAEADKEGITAEMLIMKDFTDNRLDELLVNLRKAGVPKIELKAVFNENNQYWTLKELFDELVKENQAMKGKQS